MDLDLVNGMIVVSTGLFILLVGLAFYGLVISGAMLAATFGLIVQKRENVKEIRRFNAMMLELQDTNRLWYGNPDAKNGFSGLDDAIKNMEFLEDRD